MRTHYWGGWGYYVVLTQQPSENEHGDPSSISVRPHFCTVFRTELCESEVKQLISPDIIRIADLLNHLPVIA